MGGCYPLFPRSFSYQEGNCCLASSIFHQQHFILLTAHKLVNHTLNCRQHFNQLTSFRLSTACYLFTDILELFQRQGWERSPEGWDGAHMGFPKCSIPTLIERLRVQILAGAAGEFCSPELIFCDDSY